MKLLAFVLSFYVLSLAAVPGIQMLQVKLAENCKSVCSGEPKPSQADGCEKQQCCLVSCCYFSLLFYAAETKYSFHQYFATTIENNFGRQQIVASFNFFDIWHPPRLA
jgi:hypothetical protein